MKKLIFIFVILFILVIATGCGARKNTVKFNPIDNVEESGEGVDIMGEVDLGPDLAVTSFIGDKMETNVGYHVIRGTTPKNTNSIKINDYKLTKYYPGQTEWSYIASASMGTLAEGDNEYIVMALDKEGAEIGSQTFTIAYEAPDNLPSTGSNGWIYLIISFLVSSGYFAFGSEVARRKIRTDV
jgi:hypothetical protein